MVRKYRCQESAIRGETVRAREGVREDRDQFQSTTAPNEAQTFGAIGFLKKHRKFQTQHLWGHGRNCGFE
jgi:hypothetical protein